MWMEKMESEIIQFSNKPMESVAFTVVNVVILLCILYGAMLRNSDSLFVYTRHENGIRKAPKWTISSFTFSR